MKSLSLYLHIPFCRQACSYCDFYFVVSLRGQDAFFAALRNEITLYHRFCFSPPPPISSIYFGGGTPSWVDPRQIRETLEMIYCLYREGEWDSVEITLEANPDDLTPERMEEYLKAGVNRISLGIQSFDQSALTYLKRGHDPVQAKSALRLLSKSYREKALRSWSMDLIYGIPSLGGRGWGEGLKIALQEEPPHLSLYALTVEPGTSLEYHTLEKGKKVPSTEAAREQYGIASSFLQTAGYEHYEISSYALPGHRSRHNTGYWEYRDYWGGGPGAHSFFQGKRFYNHSRLHSYIRTLAPENTVSLRDKEDFSRLIGSVREEETLTPEASYNEYLMVGLRTQEGIRLVELESRFPTLYKEENFRKRIREFRERGWLSEEGGRIQLTEAGWLMADGISRDLFL